MRHRAVLRGLSGLLVLATPALAHSAPTLHPVSGRKFPVAHRSSHSRLIQSRRVTAHTSTPAFGNMVSLSGRVILPSGAPASRARVFLSWVTSSNQMRFHAIQTNEYGVFGQSVRVADSSPGSRMFGLTGIAPGKGIAWRRVTEPKQLVNLSLRLQSGATVTGRLVRPDGSPAAGAPISVETLMPTIAQMTGQDFQFFATAQVLEEKEARAAFHTVTDPDGRFTLTGLPHDSNAGFTLGKGLVLMPGSLLPLNVGATDHQDAGILVATQTGGLKVRVVDKATGKPAAEAPVVITGQGTRTNAFGFAMQQQQQQNMDRIFRQAVTDAKGELEAKGLLPGSYQVSVAGQAVEATVEANRVGEVPRFALRQGPLRGRLLDANGKPAANVGIAMNPTPLNTTGTITNMVFGQSPFMVTMWERQQVARTDSKGNFEIQGFPWGSPEVTVRATRGDDRAEWRGPASEVGSMVKLRLAPHALVTVTGRLIDPQRRPIAQAQGQALHWTGLPRSTWFGNAQTVQSDGQGRFKLAGLERSESFSLVTGGPMFNNNMANNTRSGMVKNFESPRFVTKNGVQEQDLGDVMVHPLENGQQAQQLYDTDPPEETAASFNLLPAPTAEMAAEARAALAKYVSALKAGDIAMAQSLSSRLSSGWSAPRDQFLRNGSLRVSALAQSADPVTLHAVRFVPRFTVATLIAMNAGTGNMFGFNSTAASRELERYPNWVILTTGQNSHERVAGVLRQEDGAWRVVNDLLGQPFSSVEALLLRVPEAPAAARKAAHPATQPLSDEQLAAARQIGEQYLQLWAQDRPEGMLRLTAVESPDHAAKLADYTKQFEERMDDGACPVDAKAGVQLQPVRDLTNEEQEWLANFVQIRSQVLPARRMHIRQQQAGNGNAAPGTLSVFRYSAAGREMLMLLKRHDGKWQVIEPALPL